MQCTAAAASLRCTVRLLRSGNLKFYYCSESMARLSGGRLYCISPGETSLDSKGPCRYLKNGAGDQAYQDCCLAWREAAVPCVSVP